MKVFSLMVLTVFIVIFNANGAFATNSSAQSDDSAIQESLSDIGMEFSNEIRKVASEHKGIIQANKQLKEAGASYQKSLIADPAEISRYTDFKHQSIMAGVLTFDAGYAALFLQKKDLAALLKARKTLSEKIGFSTPLSPKMKQLIMNPEMVQDYDTWATALNEVSAIFLANGLNTDKRIAVMMDYLYGAIVEGLYVVTESIAQADYTPKMLALMNNQYDRIQLLVRMLNVFRGNDTFEKAVDFDARFNLIGDIHNLMTVKTLTRRDIDDIRQLIVPERQSILN